MLNSKEKKQYSKQIQLSEIGIDGQQKLKNSKILVVGAGGLGCPVLIQLTSTGVGEIGLIDDDLIELDNLPRQILYDFSSLGIPKVTKAVQKLSNLNPNVNFIPFSKKLTSQNAIEVIQAFDLVVDCSDNFQTRYLINDTCLVLNKPFIYGAVHKHEGQVATFNVESSGTYRCLFPSSNYSELNCNDVGVTPALTNIIGSFQANEALKLLCGYGKLLTNSVLIIDSLSLHHSLIHYTPKRNYSYINHNYIRNASNYQNDCKNEIRVQEIDTVKLAALKKEAIQLIDVREHHEIPIVNDLLHCKIPMSELSEKVDLIEKNKMVVLFCSSGKRSKKAIQQLISLSFNYNNLYSLKGGIDAYLQKTKTNSVA